MYRLKHLPKWVLPTGLVVGGMGAMFVYRYVKELVTCMVHYDIFLCI